MKIKNMIFPFAATSKILEKHWWHRLSKFIFTLILCLSVLFGALVLHIFASSEVSNREYLAKKLSSDQYLQLLVVALDNDSKYENEDEFVRSLADDNYLVESSEHSLKKFEESLYRTYWNSVYSNVLYLVACLIFIFYFSQLFYYKGVVYVVMGASKS